MDRPRRRPAATLRLTPFEAPPAGARWTPASSTLSGATPSTTKAFAMLGLLNGARHKGRTLWTGDSFGQWLLHKPRRARWMGSKGLCRLGGESGCLRFFEGDQAGGELEQREVVVVLFGPADQDRAVSVQPRVAGLDDPAARAPPGHGDLLAARADMGREPVLDGQLVHRRRVIGPVEAEPVGRLRCRLRALDRNRAESFG